jgi:Protein of unknown function (DUF1559)
VPRDLEAICLMAMAKEPARRYAGAAELADDLDRWLAGEPVRARRPGLRERAGRWLRRRRQIVLLAAGVLAAVAVTLAAVWWGGGFASPPPSPSPPPQPPQAEGSPASEPDIDFVERQNLADCVTNLRAIGGAIHSYDPSTGRLPQPAIYGSDGTPLLSWRVAILPKLGPDYEKLFKSFHTDEPWYSPHNRALLPQMPKVYTAPGDKNANESFKTHYQVFVGPGALFESDRNQFIRLNNVVGPHANTLLLAEAAEPVEWTRPADLAVERGKPLPRLGGLAHDGFLVCFVNNQPGMLSQEICRHDDVMWAIISRNPDQLLSPRPYEIDLPERLAPPNQDSDFRRKNVSRNNLQRLAQALLNQAKGPSGTLPPPAIYGGDGKPLLSWRVAILPSLGQQKLFDSFNRTEPWNSDHNRKLLDNMPKEFIAPGAPLKDPNTTYYQLFVGAGAYEPGDKRRTITAIRDGRSNTIAIAEGAEAVPWTAPVDLSYSPDGPLPKLGGPFPGGFNAALFDGSTWYFKKEIYADEKALRALIGWDDGEVVNLRPYQEPLLRSAPKDSILAVSMNAAARVYSQNNLKQLGVALLQYQSARNAFPPYAITDKEGKLLLSWRVAVLPYLGQEALYKKFKLNEAWDSDNNKELLAQMPRVFDLPDAEAAKRDKTFYQVFVGPGAGFELNPARRVRLSDVRRPAAETLLVVEAREAVPWTKPDDLFVEPDKPLPPLGGLFTDGFYAFMFDGSVHFIGAKIYQDEKALRALIDIRSGEHVDIESYR